MGGGGDDGGQGGIVECQHIRAGPGAHSGNAAGEGGGKSRGGIAEAKNKQMHRGSLGGIAAIRQKGLWGERSISGTSGGNGCLQPSLCRSLIRMLTAALADTSHGSVVQRFTVM